MSDPANPTTRRPTYAGIGARKTPAGVLADMTRIAQWLCRTGWHLNSGGANGADRAFAEGASPEARTLYLPWPGYNGHTGPDCRTLTPDEMESALTLAARVHPAWSKCSRGVRALHARNAGIVLGRELANPVDAVVCWTPGGRICGGTGNSIRMAETADIPVLNLAQRSPRDVCLALRDLRRAAASETASVG